MLVAGFDFHSMMVQSGIIALSLRHVERPQVLWWLVHAFRL